MTKSIVTCAALVALNCLTAGEAEAGKVYTYSYGTPIGTSHGAGFGGYTYSPTSYYPHVHPTVYPSHVTPRSSVVWHNTSHWDRVPASITFGPGGIRYNPGGYVWHNDGHYDTVHHGGHDHDHHHHP